MSKGACLNPVGVLREAQVAQHHDAGQQQRRGVGLVLAGDVRSSPMYRLHQRQAVCACARQDTVVSPCWATLPKQTQASGPSAVMCSYMCQACLGHPDASYFLFEETSAPSARWLLPVCCSVCRTYAYKYASCIARKQSMSFASGSPILADGVRPRPPMRPAQRSEMMSPYRLGITWMQQNTACCQTSAI